MNSTDAEKIAYGIECLYDSYKPEGIGFWLQRNRRLNDTTERTTPLDLLKQSRVDEFVSLCEATGDMIAT